MERAGAASGAEARVQAQGQVRWGVLVLAGVLLLGTARCSAGREPDDLALVRALGVDGTDPVQLTAVCGGEDQEDPSRGSCTGTDFAEALQELPWSGTGTQELSVTSVTDVILGPEADPEEVLLQVLRDRELGAASMVWLAEDSAAQVLGAGEDPAGTLALLRRQGTYAPTAAEALAELLSSGQAELPVLGESAEGPVYLGQQTVRCGSQSGGTDCNI